MERGPSFGDWVRRRRRSLDLTQADLADRVGCAVITVRKIERDERRPSRELAGLLGEALLIDEPSRERFVAAARAYLSPIRLEPADPDGSPSVRPTAPVSPLIGREKEIAELRGLWSFAGGSVRLLTITGPPGVGKTRLAEELAAIAHRDFDIPVVIVALEQARTPDQVIALIGESLALPVGSPRDPLEMAARALDRTPTLLVLDNFEQVVDAVTDVLGLLARCPDLACLVTSRVRLDCRGETDYPLEPLRVPLSGERLTPDRIDEWPAVRLFLQSAPYPVARRGLDLDIVAEICRALDGLPLALELAAMLLRHLSLGDLAEQLPSRLGALSTTARGWPMRRRSVDVAVGWSYELLSARARQALRAASVFAGGITVEALAATAGLDLAEATAAVHELADQSLIRDDGPAGRSRLLAVIRAFAADRLREEQLEDATRERHARYVLDYAEAAAALVDAWSNDRYQALLDLEASNVAAALDWSFSGHGDLQVGRRVLVATGPYFISRTRLTEAYGWGRQALAAARKAEDRAAPAFITAECAWGLGDEKGARRLLARAERAARSARDTRWLPQILGDQGMMAMVGGDLEEAGRRFLESAAMSQPGEAHALAVMRLGRLAYVAGAYDDAVRHNEEALGTYRAIGDLWGIATAIANRADIELARGELADARSDYLESIATFLEGGFDWFAASRCEGLANMMVRAGALEAAAVMYGFMGAWLDDLGVSPNPITALGPQFRERARAELGDAFDRLAEEGAGLPRTLQAIEEATPGPGR